MNFAASATLVDGTTGSVFCPYSKTSSTYDQTRAPIGVSAKLGAFVNSALPLNQQRLLDLGGGTGTFMKEVHHHFKTADLFEYDNGMLDKAKVNLAGTGVNFTQGSADKLPFDDASFNAITINQVIHHFPTEQNYAFLAKVFKECARVLAPGGVLVLDHCTHEQHKEGYWWFKLMPEACKAYCEASPPMPTCLMYMRQAGLNVNEDEIFTPLEGTLMTKDTYLRKYGLEGAFVEAYRNGDSGWTMGEKTGELQPMQKAIRAIQAAGREAEWIAEREAARKKVGQVTFVVARKPAVTPRSG